MRGTGGKRHFGIGMLGRTLAPALLAVSGAAFAGEEAPAIVPPAAVAPDAAPQVLDLRTCRAVALERQPAVAASRASLSAAVAKQQALDRLHLAALIQRELPIRRKQAALGVQAGEAALSQAEWDTLYGVTFSYLSALYAREQLAVADRAVEDLRTLLESVEPLVKEGSARKEIGQPQVNQIKAYLFSTRGRREEALEGYERALSALREAMGVAPDCPILLADAKMSDLNAAPEKGQIVALALARRGELQQATAAEQATCYEIDAQKASRMLSSRTFASGSDIHVQPLPSGVFDENYKPGALGIEMPALMPGKRADRVEQARAYHARAGAVVEKTRNLVALDAEQAFLRWLEASRKLKPYHDAAAAAREAAAAGRKAFNPAAGGKGTVEEVISGGFLATQLDLQLNQARYQTLLGLASLERATAGGFCPGFETALADPR